VLAAVVSYIAHQSIFIAYIIITLCLFLYLSWLKSYTIKKAAILTLMVMMIGLIFDFTVALMIHINLYDMFLTLVVSRPYLNVIYSVAQLVIGITLTVLFVKFTQKIRRLINQSDKAQMILLCIFILMYMVLLVYASASVEHIVVHGVMDIMFIVLVISIIVLLVVYFAFTLFAKFLETKYRLQRQLDEQRILQYYTHEIEQQYTAMRKVLHDYQNILTPLHTFIQEKDYAGLEQYYMAYIGTTADTLSENNFALERLSKIKVREIKSILAAKLMLAHSKGIDAAFEADGTIDNIPVDPVKLVRMLGIILDNAIEEIAALGTGKLLVGCFTDSDTVTFVVQNTCRPDIPKLRDLQQVGFSTKGDGRGLGLSSLAELAESCPNVVLWTSIKADNFIQKLVICGGGAK